MKENLRQAAAWIVAVVGVVVMGAGPARAETSERIRVLVMPFQGNAVDAETVRTLDDLISARLAEYPSLNVVSKADVQRMVELEGSKQMMGCDDGGSCLAEIAGALGARLVVFGSAGKLGAITVLNIGLFDAQLAQNIGRQSVEVRDVSEIPQALRPKIRLLVGPFLTENGQTLPPEEAVVATGPAASEPGPDLSPAAPWLVAGGAGSFVVGTGLAVLGAIPLLSYGDRQSALGQLEEKFGKEQDPALLEQAAELRTGLTSDQAAWNSFGLPAAVAGATLGVVGVVALGTGIVISALSREPDEGSTP